MSLDAQNLLIQDWMTTTAAVHDSTVAKVQIDSGQGYKYFLADSAYDSQRDMSRILCLEMEISNVKHLGNFILRSSN